MEDIPPSYDQSTNPSVLDLVAPYLDTSSLHALALVSRTYNETFMPHLWGSPASHFVPVTGPTAPGVPATTRFETAYDDIVYVALTRFKRILRIARESTRRLTHTLYLPAANSEIYSGPNATWLREILDGLPNLQSLCVSGLPFFDHHSLVAVDRRRSSQPERDYQRYQVKLLMASKEPNTTSIGLSLFLPHLCYLVYLDLSFTTPARDTNVLSSLHTLNDLQVLKLRGIGLHDMEVEVLANAIGLRVRLLDLADNLLGDMAIRSLLEACFVHPTGGPDNINQTNGNNNTFNARSDYQTRRHLESWPVGLPPAPDFLSLDTLRSADLDQNLLVQLTNPLTGRLAFEDIPHSGLTHLYITGNPAVTVEGVKSLLEVGRLHVLDAGDIAGETAVDRYVRNARSMGKWHGRSKSIGSGGPRSATGSPFQGGQGTYENENRLLAVDDMNLPGTEKLIPVLRERASSNLTFLRIEHSVVTKAHDGQKDGDGKSNKTLELHGSTSLATEMEDSAPGKQPFEVLGSNRLAVEAPGSNHHAVELPTVPNFFELDSTSVVRAELPGDPIHFAISPPVGEKPAAHAERLVGPIRGDGAFAPEVAKTEDEIVVDVGEAGHRGVSRTMTVSSSPTISSEDPGTSIGSVRSTLGSNTSESWMLPPVDERSRLQDLLKTRPTLKSPRLHPSNLPNLRTLILTNVPAQVLGRSSPVLVSIKRFIAACAIEAHIAVLRTQTNYSLPPGRARAAAERKHADSLFALKTIVLEVAPVQDVRERDWKHTRQRLDISKSSTGDHDSEAMWSAAENDFSFFGEEGEEHDECGIYEHEPGKYFPSVHLDDKFAVVADDVTSTSSTPSSSSNFTLNSPTGAIFRSPRELPLGRNRRVGGDGRDHDTGYARSHQRWPSSVEMPGTIPTSEPRSPRQQTVMRSASSKTMFTKSAAPPQMVDLVAELSKWRRERKAAHEEEQTRRRRQGFHIKTVDGIAPKRLVDTEIYIEGHWKGEIKVVKNSKPVGSSTARASQGRLERTGMVDIYGNYFEKGYLYS